MQIHLQYGKDGLAVEIPSTNVTVLAPLEYLPLVQLKKQAYLVITDSGGIQEEAPGLGKPVLVRPR